MSKTREVVGIQYLRGIAAMAVVFDHTSAMASFDKYFGKVFLSGALSSGARGVDLFFLISGFIICAVSLAEDGRTPRIGLLDFFERRFCRIVPMMWLAIVSYALLRLSGRGDFASHATSYLRALFLVPWGAVEPNQIWTLRHEAIFYLLFALSYLTGRRRVWILALWAVSPLAYAALAQPPGAQGETFFHLLCNPVNVEFIMGYVICLLWHRRTRDLSFLTPIHPLYLMTLACVAIMALNLILPPSLPDLLVHVIFALCFAPVLLMGVHVVCPPGLADRIGRLFGDASYVIYLFHPHIVSALLGIWAHRAHGTPLAVVIAGTAAAATAGGLLIHLQVEGHVVRATKQAAARWSRRPLPAG